MYMCSTRINYYVCRYLAKLQFLQLAVHVLQLVAITLPDYYVPNLDCFRIFLFASPADVDTTANQRPPSPPLASQCQEGRASESLVNTDAHEAV